MQGQTEGSHVTNLLGDIQNPVIALNPHLFLQEEGGYRTQLVATPLL